MSSLLTPLHHEAELRRLDALHELDVLDTAPDPDIDRPQWLALAQEVNQALDACGDVWAQLADASSDY